MELPLPQTARRFQADFTKPKARHPGPLRFCSMGWPGIEKHSDIAYELHDTGLELSGLSFSRWLGIAGNVFAAGLTEDPRGAVEWVKRLSVDNERLPWSAAQGCLRRSSRRPPPRECERLSASVR